MEKLNSYPIVGFHGFVGFGEDDILGKYIPYFGVWNGNARDVANEMGLEYYQPNIGGYSGAWDRCCEMWAHLLGGTVDYGKVHSEKFGHIRYGRTYDALIPDWGTLDAEGKRKKINLIGHSFGGPSMRMFLELVVRGSQEEIERTPADELSELFKGGKEDWIHSCTSLAGALNGFTLNEVLDPFVATIEKIGYTILSTLGQTKFNKFYNVNLYQFGITDMEPEALPKITSRKKEIDHFISLREDNISYELTVEGAEKMSKNLTTFPKTYYFARHGCRTHEGINGIQVPNRSMLTLFKPMGIMEGLYYNQKNPKKPFVDKSWRENDAIVNVPAAKYPLNGDPYEEFNGTANCKPGIWYWFPTENKDHLSFNGIGEKSINDYYRGLFEIMCSVPSVE